MVKTTASFRDYSWIAFAVVMKIYNTSAYALIFMLIYASVIIVCIKFKENATSLILPEIYIAININI